MERAALVCVAQVTACAIGVMATLSHVGAESGPPFDELVDGAGYKPGRFPPQIQTITFARYHCDPNQGGICALKNADHVIECRYDSVISCHNMS